MIMDILVNDARVTMRPGEIKWAEAHTKNSDATKEEGVDTTYWWYVEPWIEADNYTKLAIIKVRRIGRESRERRTSHTMVSLHSGHRRHDHPTWKYSMRANTSVLAYAYNIGKTGIMYRRHSTLYTKFNCRHPTMDGWKYTVYVFNPLPFYLPLWM